MLLSPFPFFLPKRVIMKYALFALALLFALPVMAEEKPAVPATPAPVAVAPAAPTVESLAPADQKVPDVSGILFMENLRKIGATIYYLGQDLGLHGWFVVKDDQVQMLYTTPDNKALLVGALLSAEGANVSQQQVLLLANSNPKIQELLKRVGNGASVNVAGDTTKGGASSSAPAESPSEKFMAALLKGTTVTFGAESAPQLVMVMDVRCPHCHRAWKSLAPHVDAGRLRVTLFPIAGQGPQSQVEGANWLAMADKRDAWNKHVAGDEKILKGDKPDPEKEKAMLANTQLIQEWKVQQTPYILYRGKNGKVRVIEGEPQSVDVLLADIGG